MLLLSRCLTSEFNVRRMTPFPGPPWSPPSWVQACASEFLFLFCVSFPWAALDYPLLGPGLGLGILVSAFFVALSTGSPWTPF